MTISDEERNRQQLISLGYQVMSHWTPATQRRLLDFNANFDECNVSPNICQDALAKAKGYGIEDGQLLNWQVRQVNLSNHSTCIRIKSKIKFKF